MQKINIKDPYNTLLNLFRNINSDADLREPIFDVLLETINKMENADRFLSYLLVDFNVEWERVWFFGMNLKLKVFLDKISAKKEQFDVILNYLRHQNSHILADLLYKPLLNEVRSKRMAINF